MVKISFSEQKCFDCLFGTAEMFPGLWQQDLEGRLAGLNVLEKKNIIIVTCVEKGCTEVGVKGRERGLHVLGQK